MISEGEKKYIDHAIELDKYVTTKGVRDSFRERIVDKLMIPYGYSDERNGKVADSKPNQETANKDGQKKEEIKAVTPACKLTDEEKRKTQAILDKYNSVEIARAWRLKYPDKGVILLLSDTEIGIGQYLKTENDQHFPEVAKALGDIGWVWNKDSSTFIWEGGK
jgi:hypothetical protein